MTFLVSFCYFNSTSFCSVSMDYLSRAFLRWLWRPDHRYWSSLREAGFLDRVKCCGLWTQIFTVFHQVKDANF